MSNFMCHEHQHGFAVDARARMNAHVAPVLAISTPWFTTKPYGSQRPSGAPPG